MITTTSTLQFVTDGELYVPPMAAQPLKTALKNLNYLWKWHRPPLVDLCPTRNVAADRGFVAHIPIRPSADGLPYTFETRIWPAATSTCTVKIEYCTTYAGAGTTWTNLVTTASIAMTDTTHLTHTDASLTIPAAAVALRLTVTAAGSDRLRVDHFLVYPTPIAPVAGIASGSGFVPFDDGLLGAAGAPIHTELINRCKLSAVAVIRDRWQMAVSFVQQAESTVAYSCSGSTTWTALPPMRVYLPGQTGGHLYLQVLATVDAGATADLVRVRQIGVAGGLAATFNADETLDANGFDVFVQRPGELGAYVDLEIACRNTAGSITSLRTVVGFWRPNDDGTAAALPLVSAVTPAAAVSLLQAAVRWPQDAAKLPYCGCAKLHNGQRYTDNDARAIGVMLAPGATHLRAGIGRGFDYNSGLIDGTGPVVITSAASGSGAADAITHAPPAYAFWSHGFGFGMPYFGVTETGTAINDAPAATVDRQIETDSFLYPYVESATIRRCSSFAHFVSEQADLATL